MIKEVVYKLIIEVLKKELPNALGRSIVQIKENLIQYIT